MMKIRNDSETIDKGERGMPSIGILCDRDRERAAIGDAIGLLAAREGFDYPIREIDIGKSEQHNELLCVILDCADRETAFAYADLLWRGKPSLPVVFVSYKAEDIFAALGMPFFHTARSYNLEQDLEAAFRKLRRMKASAADKTGFTRNGKVMLIPHKEILYLESERHDIRIHLGTDVFPVGETLSQCEEKLKGMGFVRTDRSFLVNMYHIRCLEKENVLLDNGERLYVSRRRFPEVKLLFENYIRHLDFI